MENTYHHTQLPEGRIPALRVEPMPADTNQSGEVFGGWVMSQVDLAGANTAMRYALSRYIVTRAVSSLTFEAPVLVGDVVAQRIFAPTQLPVGVVTGSLGGVYLMWLLVTEWRRNRE